ncbi:DNA-directed RNA polymerases II 24 kDa polypeptide (RNA polymerase II subunit 5) [Rhizophlyctis rosea]|uniref:DNA-directed RNA polymerases I, II, and III subunit RPABC1 n=1 Tax=Rhizophlyctis rosea TaxID=64517 RepID=A0AAD5X6S8_9FUNG|nr:DNA-directed RNA polymerases II 24 kDa polypeptide (RNA polymerase II subunit 5) [Rhizophlyctis rosea]
MSYEENERAIARMWRVYKTCYEMVQDRGYVVSHSEVNILLDEFRQSKCPNGQVNKKEMQIMVEHRSTGQGLLVSFLVDESVGIKPIRQVIEDMMVHKVERGIVVYPKTLTPGANKGLAEVQGTLTVETFTEAELLVNITKHVLVPKHEVMSDEEKKILLDR